MCNAIVGKIVCPVCMVKKLSGKPYQCDGTIHVHAKGKKKYYMRCYHGESGVKMKVGTYQLMGDEGQEYIREFGDFHEGSGIGKQDHKPEIDAIASPEPETIPDDLPPPREKSALERFLIG